MQPIVASRVFLNSLILLLSFHLPHKFRHGNAVYSIKLAKKIAALKAVSQNQMHSNLTITDGINGIFSEKEVRQEIISLGQMRTFEKESDIDLLINLAEIILEKNSGQE